MSKVSSNPSDEAPPSVDEQKRSPINSRLQRVLARHRTDSDTCVSLAYQNKALRAQAKKSAAEHAKELSKARKELNCNKKLCDSLQNDKQALESTLEAIKCQHTQLSEEHQLVLERANRADTRIAQLQESLLRAEANVTTLQKKLDAEIISRAQETKSNEVADNDGGSSPHAVKINKLERRIKQKDEKYLRMESELRAYISQLEKASEERHSAMVKQYEEKLSKLTTVFDDKISSWKKQVTELTKALTQTSTRYSELEAHVTKSKADYDLLDARQKAALAELSILKRERETVTSHSQREISRYSTVIQRLKELYVEKEGEFDKVLARNVAIETDLEAFEKLLETEDERLNASRSRKRRRSSTNSNSSVVLSPISTPVSSSKFNFSVEMTPRAVQAAGKRSAESSSEQTAGNAVDNDHVAPVASCK